jgi:hypothetical protein
VSLRRVLARAADFRWKRGHRAEDRPVEDVHDQGGPA